MTCLSWVVLHGMAHSFIELCKPLRLDKAVIHEGDSVLYRFKIVLLLFLWVLVIKRLEEVTRPKQMPCSYIIL